MQSLSERLDSLIKPVVASLGYEALGIETVGARSDMKLRIYIDVEHGITLDDCERVSRQVSALLDVEDPINGKYTLEVSSPGLDRPLFTRGQFERELGRRVKVNLRVMHDGRRRFEGTLTEVQPEQLTLVDGGVSWSLPLADLERARVVPTEEDYRARGRAPQTTNGGDGKHE